MKTMGFDMCDRMPGVQSQTAKARLPYLVALEPQNVLSQRGHNPSNHRRRRPYPCL